jgi:hypothetical protein
VWNVTRDPTQLPLYPVGWRPTKRTCAGSIDTAWAAQANFVAGTTIQPGGAAGNTVYRAQPNGTYGNMKTGGAMPAFDGVNSFADGGILWVPWGTTNDPSAWEPVIHESVVAISISVAGSSNVTLTEDQGGHQRIIFTGALTGNIKVFVPTGCAAGWGPRLFVNRTSGPFTLMIVANENQGDIGQVLFQGSAQLLWHDGGHIFPAGAAVTQGTTESAILGVKDVTAGGTIALTADEAAHSILKFTGAPVAGVSAIVPAGSAGCWSRTFFNDCSQTVTVKATTVDVGVAVANGVSTRLWSDSMTVRQIT